MHEEIHTYTWYVGDGGMPGGLTQAQAYAAFADAIDNITKTYNDCGISDTVDAKSSYAGTSTYEADINASSQCTPRDEQNTWDAGDLAAGHLAVTCSWTVDGTTSNLRELVEADVRYNTTDNNFTNSPSSSCVNLYDIRAVGTHEAGHVFGMDHVSAAHPDLTMSPSINACDTSDRTLGRGDYLTLEAIY
ncbi:matrixin family metalloprotease [Streptomyces coeruleoprunus]